MIPSARAAVLRCCIVIGALVTFVLIMWMISASRSGAWAATVESRVPGPVCHAKCDYLRQPGPADDAKPDTRADCRARRAGCYPESIRHPQSGWIMSGSTCRRDGHPAHTHFLTATDLAKSTPAGAACHACRRLPCRRACHACRT